MSDERVSVSSAAVGRGRRVIRWVIYTLLFALLPFLFVTLIALLFRKPISPALFAQRGELMIVATVLAFGALGELRSPLDRLQDRSGVLFDVFQVFAILVGGAAAFLYGVIIAVEHLVATGVLASSSTVVIAPDLVVIVSYWLFGLAVVAGLLCVAYE